MLREYVWRGSTWQFDEEDAPASAVIRNKSEIAENKGQTSKPKTTRKKTSSKPKETTEAKTDDE